MRHLTIVAIGLGLAACASSPEVSEAEDLAGLAVVRADTDERLVTASLWDQDPQSLFGNRRAREVGDILTVIVSVDEAAQLQNNLQRTRVNEEQFSVNALFGAPGWAAGVLPGGATLTPGVDVSREQQMQGRGQLNRQERITLRLAAEVVDQRPNGHLIIKGSQRIRVNDEVRDLRIAGIVRPEDITRDNTIAHDKIAAADILYSGGGLLEGGASRRLGSRVLDIVVPF